MEHRRDLAIVLKTFRYAERDLVVVFLSENHGKFTAMAKGGVHSRRFGGALSLLAASELAWVLKPNAEMGRIDEALIRQEFVNIHKDYHRLSAASFMVELCLKLIEPATPARELFVALSNALYHLDRGCAPLSVMGAFLTKFLRILGYAPQLLRCGVCQKEVSQVADASTSADIRFGWDPSTGHVTCPGCVPRNVDEMSVDTILLYCDFLVRPFKELKKSYSTDELQLQLDLYRKLVSFLHHHIPAIHSAGGLKTLASIDESALLVP